MSSGAMWMGDPTMLPVIRVSGLQKPKSVNLALLLSSNCVGFLDVMEGFEVFWDF